MFLLCLFFFWGGGGGERGGQLSMKVGGGLRLDSKAKTCNVSR